MILRFIFLASVVFLYFEPVEVQVEFVLIFSLRILSWSRHLVSTIFVTIRVLCRRRFYFIFPWFFVLISAGWTVNVFQILFRIFWGCFFSILHRFIVIGINFLPFSSCRYFMLAIKRFQLIFLCKCLKIIVILFVIVVVSTSLMISLQISQTFLVWWPELCTWLSSLVDSIVYLIFYLFKLPEARGVMSWWLPFIIFLYSSLIVVTWL